jgi:hypothetical protein
MPHASVSGFGRPWWSREPGSADGRRIPGTLQEGGKGTDAGRHQLGPTSVPAALVEVRRLGQTLEQRTDGALAFFE